MTHHEKGADRRCGRPLFPGSGMFTGSGTDQEVVIPLLLAFGWRLAQLGLQDQLVSPGEERQGLGFGDLGQVGLHGLEVRDD